MRLSTKSRLLLTAVTAASIAASAAPSFAQNTGEDVVVTTGTRLNVNPNLTAVSPVLTIDPTEIAARGVVNIEDLTNNLPQVFAAQAGEVSNGASGTAQLDLRGLGPVRTLTLIDGRRLPYGSSSSSAPNLDLVPTNLIERIDITTGGASAVYGSDAVSGVANFILRRDFEGAQFDAQYGFAQNNNGIDRFDDVLRDALVPVPGNVTDGEEVNVSFTLGANTDDGKGNVVLFGSYQNREEIVQADRSFSACTLGTGDVNGFSCSGSANFRLFGGPGGFTFQEENGEIVDFVGGPAQTFNFGAQNFFQRPTERFQIYSKGHYEIFEGHEIFADASFTNNFSDAQIAPSASFGIGAYSINCDNPLIQNTPGQQLTDIFGCSAADIAAGNDVSGISASHRNVEGGPRNSRLENSAWRFSGGMRGTLFENFDYEAFGQFSRTNDQSLSTNDFVISNLQQAFFAVEDANGNVVCRDQSGGCVPYNIFQRGPGGESLVTQDALDFIQGVGIVNGETEQVVLGANVQTDLGDYGVKSPFSDSGVALLVGTEYREDSLRSIPDEISQVEGGGFTGVGGATLAVEGSVDVFELYAEAQIPLVTDMPYFKELVLTGQYRYSDYTAEGNNTTADFSSDAYGAGLAWSPVDQIKLRGQYQRSVRAPNVIELFTGQNTNLPNLTQGPTGLFDPCATANPTATLEQCQRTGVTAGQFGNILDVISGQTQSLTGGSTTLQPEVSDTFTLGAVLTPDAVPSLTISVDWFSITVDDFISAGIGAQTTLDQCLATGDAAFCNLITRDSQGSLNSGTAGVGFASTNLNIARAKTSGIDFQASYNLELDSIGDINFNYASTLLNEFSFTPFPGGEAIDCAGRFGNDCVQPVNPEYRHRMLANWMTPLEALDVTATWRHFGPARNTAESPASTDVRFGARNYIDLSGNYEVVEGVRLRAGVNNVFLEQPPVSISSGPPLGNGNTYPVTYDTGRFLFVGLNVKL